MRPSGPYLGACFTCNPKELLMIGWRLGYGGAVIGENPYSEAIHVDRDRSCLTFH